MNKANLLLRFFVWPLLLLFACGPSPEKQQEEKEFFLPDSIETDGMAFALTEADKSCLQQKNTICEYGLFFVTLGMPMEEVELEEGVVKDTLFTAGGYQWLGRIFEFGPEGSVVVEGDFVDEGDPAGKLPFTRVNRIRVETAQFSAGAVKVGSSFGELLQAGNDSLVQAIYLPGYQVVDVSFPGQSRIHYNVRDESGQIGQATGQQIAKISPELIPPQAPISSIVVAL